VTLPLCANVGSGSNFKAMNGDDPRAERGVCKDADELRRTTGVEVGEAAGLRESWKGPLPREAGLRGQTVTTYRPSGSFDRLATLEVAGR
jgi:hypothetical protein